MHPLLAAYMRTIGVIQCLYGVFFAWTAIESCATGQFYHEASGGKGDDVPAYWDYEWLFTNIVFCSLSLTCFTGGVNLSRLRSGARRWEIIYLAVFSAFVTWEVVHRRSDVFSTRETIQSETWFYAIFGLPYFPAVFWPVAAKNGCREDDLAGSKMDPHPELR